MAVRFSTNVAMKFVFPFGDYMDVNGQYGPQFMYTVENPEGQRDKLYAAPGLHQELQAAGMGPGSVFTITKVEGEGNRKGWLVQPAEPNGQPAEWEPEPEPAAAGPADAPPASAEVSAPATPPPSGNGHPLAEPRAPGFAALQLLMNNALQASWLAWNGLDEGAQFSGEDVRAVGITLFLECARKGIIPQPEEAGQDLPF